MFEDWCPEEVDYLRVHSQGLSVLPRAAGYTHFAFSLYPGGTWPTPPACRVETRLDARLPASKVGPVNEDVIHQGTLPQQSKTPPERFHADPDVGRAIQPAAPFRWHAAARKVQETLRDDLRQMDTRAREDRDRQGCPNKPQEPSAREPEAACPEQRAAAKDTRRLHTLSSNKSRASRSD